MAEKNGRKILVAVDESDESGYALSWCLKTLSNSNDTLVLIYAVQPRPVYTAIDSTGYLFTADIIANMEILSNQVAQSVIDKAKKICSEFDDQITVEAMVETGDPRDVICEMADKLKVDFLVLGSHGYGTIKRAFLGSVSNHCAHKVKCPVLIVKKPKSNDAHH
ncbi:hypothetical protein ABFS82_02G092400 [Erythranthe guttata]|uniref:UspA domain-containing protein n=1 Tax=Erythranthe guttata TaxID=4155 RepID=A0A022RBY2_ERYGU|nr:PREDICTED: universal stress protein A-like protein [Erythranthe guttata]EYU37238.1 hypothetical protein MIMGU_mgv1a015255mg [Erythranthe guttata]|eukprot:XP_012837668.1 PREDICTED: universal stress protein A-like protein [Erythranthe guttata]